MRPRRPTADHLTLLAGCGPLLLAGCVTTIVDDESPDDGAVVNASPVVIPFGNVKRTEGWRPVAQYYKNVIRQMQEALAERQLEWLLALLASHDRDPAPEWARDAFASFRDAAEGLAFEDYAARNTGLVILSGPAAIGTPIELAVRLDTAHRRGVVLPGGETGVSFLVRSTISDTDVLGSTTTRRAELILRVPEAVDFDAGDHLLLPFGIAPAGQGVVMRRIEFVAELLPGVIDVGDRHAPVQRSNLVERVEMMYPDGVAPIRQQPLRTLRNALRNGEAAHFPHVFLAAHFMPVGDQPAAIKLLVSTLRLGRADQARVAMAALREITGVEINTQDREGWLRWWQERS